MLTIVDLPAWLIRGFAVVMGLLWGSFLNVVIYRLPLGQSVSRPASHCPHCGQAIRPWHNIPVLSWLWLRGKARCCGAPISARYVAVELIGGLLALAVLETAVLPLGAEASLLRGGAIFAADLALCLSLVAASFIDLEHLYIPDRISIGAAVLGLATFSFRPPLSFWEALFSALGAFALVWLLFGVLYRKLRGRTGMGLGDAKLLMVAGAWFGLPGVLFTLLAGAVQGTIAVLAVGLTRGSLQEPEAVRRERELLLQEVAAIEDPKERAQAEEELKSDPLFESSAGGAGQIQMPFGPFLALSLIEYLLVGPWLIERYFAWMGLQ